MNLALTKTEKEVLWRKYKQNGLGSWEATRRVEEHVKSLKDLVQKLRNQNKPEEHIQGKFREEFEKMCMKLEV